MPKFEWKREFPIGEIELVPDPSGPLGNITEQVLDRESNEGNKIKTEPMPSDELTAQDIELPNIPNLPVAIDDFPDATQNLLVSLPPDTELNLTDATPNVTVNDQSVPQVKHYLHYPK